VSCNIARWATARPKRPRRRLVVFTQGSLPGEDNSVRGAIAHRYVPSRGETWGGIGRTGTGGHDTINCYLRWPCLQSTASTWPSPIPRGGGVGPSGAGGEEFGSRPQEEQAECVLWIAAAGDEAAQDARVTRMPHCLSEGRAHRQPRAGVAGAGSLRLTATTTGNPRPPAMRRNIQRALPMRSWSTGSHCRSHAF
jgi:hypothetical protein